MKFKFSLSPVLTYRETLEKNAEIELGKEVQRQVALENERQNLIDEYEALVKGGVAQNKNAERYMDFISYAQRLKELIAMKNLDIKKQKENVEKARENLIKKTQEKKTIEVLRDSQKAAFKLAEKRAELKQTDESAGQKFFNKDKTIY